MTKLKRVQKNKKGGVYSEPYYYWFHNKEWDYRLDGVIVTVLASSEEDWEFNPQSGEAKDYKLAQSTQH